MKEDQLRRDCVAGCLLARAELAPQRALKQPKAAIARYQPPPPPLQPHIQHDAQRDRKEG